MLHVVAGRGSPQLQGGFVLLGMRLQRLYLFGTLSCTEYKDTGGQRIKCPCMPYLYPMPQCM